MGGDGGIILLAVYANAKAENLTGLYETDTLNERDFMCALLILLHIQSDD